MKKIIFIVLGTIGIYYMYILDTRKDIKENKIVEMDQKGEISDEKVECDVIKTKDKEYYIVFPSGELWRLHPRKSVIQNPTQVEVDVK